MNQFTASPTFAPLILDRATCSNPGAFAESRGFLPQKEYGSPSSIDSDLIPLRGRICDLRGCALQPWDRTALLSSLVEIQEARTARAVEDAVVAERNRLARELHDAVTQTLFAASLIAEVLPDLIDTDKAEAHNATEELRQLTRGALAEMRTLLFELRPAALNQASLSELLRQLSEALVGRRMLPICLDIVGDCEIPCDVKVEIYRIAQESLNNVVKYARATRVEINVRLAEEQVHMEIKDNGVGFDPSSVRPTSLGLHIMGERAEAIHAQLQVVSEPGMGTTVSLDWHR